MATGHIRNRGSNCYQITVEGERDPITGKRTRAYKTVKGTKKQASSIMRKMIDEMEQGGINKPSALKLGDWLHQWLALYRPNIEETTRAGYRDRIDNRIIPVLGNIPLKSLKAEHIQQWVNDLQREGLSPKTIKNAFHNITAALDKAVMLRMIPYNPCAAVELPKLVKYEGNFLSKGEVTNILSLVRGTDMYFIVLLAVYVGFRRGELVALQWDDIDFKNSTIHIRHNTTMADGKKISKAPKSSAGIRDVPIGAQVLNELKAAHAQYSANKVKWGKAFHDTNLVICKENGEGYRPDSITQKWERFLGRNNLRSVRLHDLRHTCATLMIEAGVDLKTVQQRMGHADISITMNIYTHCTEEMKEKGSKTLDNILFAV